MAANTRPLTLAEFHRLQGAHPDGRLELEPDGTVYEEDPRSVSFAHSLLQPRLAAALGSRRRGFVLTELNVDWGERPSYRGDIVFYARARAGELREPTTGGWVVHPTTPPDLVIEIRSPEQSRRRLQNKCSWYVRHGVHVAWLIDVIEDRTVAVYRAQLAGADVYDTDDPRPLPLPEALAGLELRAGDVFRLLEDEP
jgi:Uma2 family endonuclease